jgi:hypothetical protein
MADRLTGKASYFILDGSQVPITKATLKVVKKKADTTDNGDYVVAIDLLTPTQLMVNAMVTFAIEGRYRKSVIPAVLSQVVFESNPGGVPAVLGLDSSTVAGHGQFDVENFQCDDPVDDTVTYTCDMTSYGQFTPNA